MAWHNSIFLIIHSICKGLLFLIDVYNAKHINPLIID